MLFDALFHSVPVRAGRPVPPEVYSKLMRFDIDLIYDNVKYSFVVSKCGPALFNLAMGQVNNHHLTTTASLHTKSCSVIHIPLPERSIQF